jgi:hypothetical protein
MPQEAFTGKLAAVVGPVQKSALGKTLAWQSATMDELCSRNISYVCKPQNAATTDAGCRHTSSMPTHRKR